MSEIAPTQIVYGVLAVIIIISFLFAGTYLYSNNARNFIDKVLGLYDEEKSPETSPEVKAVEQTFFNQFFEDYQKCKKSPDTKCICNLRTIYVPENYYIEISNQNKKTSISLTQGSISNIGDVSTTQRAVPNFKDIQGTDEILFGNPSLCTDPGILTHPFCQPYIDESHNFILEGYSVISRAFLTYDDAISREAFNADVYSQTQIFTGEKWDVGTNIKGIYKADNTKMVFVPSPPYPPHADNLQLAQQFRSIPKCK